MNINELSDNTKAAVNSAAKTMKPVLSKTWSKICAFVNKYWAFLLIGSLLIAMVCISVWGFITFCLGVAVGCCKDQIMDYCTSVLCKDAVDD